jgi:hypothetical protein
MSRIKKLGDRARSFSLPICAPATGQSKDSDVNPISPGFQGQPGFQPQRFILKFFAGVHGNPHFSRSPYLFNLSVFSVD